MTKLNVLNLTLIAALLGMLTVQMMLETTSKSTLPAIEVLASS